MQPRRRENETVMTRRVIFKFRLYVAGEAANSAEAVVNLTALCGECLPQRHEIELIDVFKEPERALTDGIYMTPTLVKLTPPPVCRIVGTLSEPLTVLRALGIEARIA
jgi:circadian clock protein KaiB